MSRYDLWLTNASGAAIQPITGVVSFTLALVMGDVAILTLRTAKQFTLQRDYRVLVMRHPQRGGAERLTISFLRSFSRQHDNGGQYLFTARGEGLNGLLARRIVAFASGTAQADKTDNADDMMKEIVNENLVSPSVTARDVSGLSVAADLTAGPSITKAFAWRNVLDVLQDLQALSKTNGTEVYFGIVDQTETTWQFQTRTGQWGTDRTANNPIVFSLEWGNLSDPELIDTYEDEASYVYAGGRGLGEERNIQEVSDSARINATPYGRIEAFISAAQAQTNAGVTAAGNDALGRRRPQKRFTGEIHSTPGTPYGGLNGWRLGDKVPVQYQGQTFDALVRAVLVEVDGDGRESISARVESLA